MIQEKIKNIKKQAYKAGSLKKEAELIFELLEKYRKHLSSEEFDIYNDRLDYIASRLDNLSYVGWTDYFNGVALHNAGKNKQSFQKLENAISVFSRQNNNYGIAKACQQIAINYWAQNDYMKALKYNMDALKIYEENGYLNDKAHAYNSRGVIYNHQGQFQNALKWFNKAIELQEELGEDIKLIKQQVYHNIGVTYLALEDNQKALKYNFESLRIKEELGSVDKRGIGNSYSNIGMIYHRLGKPQEALNYFFKSLSLKRETNYKLGIANTLLNIGRVYCSEENTLEALKHLYEAQSMFYEIDQPSGIAETYRMIGNCYVILEDYEKAEDCFSKDLEIAETFEEKSLLYDALNDLYQFKKKTGDVVKALEFHERLAVANKELRYNNDLKKADDLEFKYILLEKDEELKSLEEDAFIKHWKYKKLEDNNQKMNQAFDAIIPQELQDTINSAIMMPELIMDKVVIICIEISTPCKELNHLLEKNGFNTLSSEGNTLISYSTDMSSETLRNLLLSIKKISKKLPDFKAGIHADQIISGITGVIVKDKQLMNEPFKITQVICQHGKKGQIILSENAYNDINELIDAKRIGDINTDSREELGLLTLQ